MLEYVKYVSSSACNDMEDTTAKKRRYVERKNPKTYKKLPLEYVELLYLAFMLHDFRPLEVKEIYGILNDIFEFDEAVLRRSQREVSYWSGMCGSGLLYYFSIIRATTNEFKQKIFEIWKCWYNSLGLSRIDPLAITTAKNITWLVKTLELIRIINFCLRGQAHNQLKVS